MEEGRGFMTCCLPWPPNVIEQAIRGYTASQNQIAWLQGELERLEVQRQGLEADLSKLRLPLAPGPMSGRWLRDQWDTGDPPSMDNAAKYLPLPLASRTDLFVHILPLADWGRFVEWVVPLARSRPYRTADLGGGFTPDAWDCTSYVKVILGRAYEWTPSPTIGWVSLKSPRGTGHQMNFLLAEENGAVRLFYLDATPRGVVPWPEGLFTDLQGWRLEKLGF